MPQRESGQYERSVLQPVVRRLREPERRILMWGLIRERRRMAKTAPLITLLTGLVIFGSLWGLSILAWRADNSGPSWRTSGLIWLAIGIPISVWAHHDIRKFAATRDGSLASALKMNRAVEIRVRADAVVVLESGVDSKRMYAFQVEGKHIVFVPARRSARFPNSDFTLVDLLTQKQRPAAGLIEKHGQKLEPVRRIPAEMTARLKLPDELSVIPGELSQVEQVLAPGIH